MSLVSFHDWFPEEAELEPLVISLDREQARTFDLPIAQFLLSESVCTNPECQCGEVIVSVVSTGFNGVLGRFAVEFGAGSAPLAVRRLEDEPANDYSARIIRLLASRLNADPRFGKRLRRHYELVKSRARRAQARRTFLRAARSKFAR
jgi:hypothetical protein